MNGKSPNHALQRTVTGGALRAASAQNKFALASRVWRQSAAAQRGRWAACIVPVGELY
jgi:hypothetical protein